jgi:hypothetical protein
VFVCLCLWLHLSCLIEVDSPTCRLFSECQSQVFVAKALFSKEGVGPDPCKIELVSECPLNVRILCNLSLFSVHSVD